MVKGLTFRAASAMTRTSGRKSASEMWKSASSVASLYDASKPAVPPTNQKPHNAIARAPADSTPVRRTCAYRSTLATPAARFTESDKGDTVSPK